jgi:uncharacterized membrane protein
MNTLLEIFPVSLIVVSVFLGIMGQFIRAMIGIYKVWQDETVDTKTTLNARKFFSSLLMGALAGLVACLIFDKIDSKADAISILGFGYMGADAIEGIFKKRGGAVK